MMLSTGGFSGTCHPGTQPVATACGALAEGDVNRANISAVREHTDRHRRRPPFAAAAVAMSGVVALAAGSARALATQPHANGASQHNAVVHRVGLADGSSPLEPPAKCEDATMRATVRTDGRNSAARSEQESGASSVSLDRPRGLGF
jgi:hypothetical protein